MTKITFYDPVSPPATPASPTRNRHDLEKDMEDVCDEILEQFEDKGMELFQNVVLSNKKIRYVLANDECAFLFNSVGEHPNRDVINMRIALGTLQKQEPNSKLFGIMFCNDQDQCAEYSRNAANFMGDNISFLSGELVRKFIEDNFTTS